MRIAEASEYDSGEHTQNKDRDHQHGGRRNDDLPDKLPIFPSKAGNGTPHASGSCTFGGTGNGFSGFNSTSHRLCGLCAFLQRFSNRTTVIRHQILSFRQGAFGSLLTRLSS